MIGSTAYGSPNPKDIDVVLVLESTTGAPFIRLSSNYQQQEKKT